MRCLGPRHLQSLGVQVAVIPIELFTPDIQFTYMLHRPPRHSTRVKKSEELLHTLNGTSSTYFSVRVLNLEILFECGCAVNMLSGSIYCLGIGNADHEIQL